MQYCTLDARNQKLLIGEGGLEDQGLIRNLKLDLRDIWDTCENVMFLAGTLLQISSFEYTLVENVSARKHKKRLRCKHEEQ